MYYIFKCSLESLRGMHTVGKHKCDDNLVKVFSKDEWNQLNARIHAEEIHAAKIQQERDALENIKERSFAIHKDWTNTNLVGALP